MAKFALSEPLVLLNQSNGIVLVPADTPLTSLNYFDGKFLRAEDLQAEQTYFRRLSQLSNQAGGSGVVHGFNLARLAGDRIQLGAGLAVDGDGRVLFMPDQTDVSIPELIARSVASATGKSGAAGAGGADFAECELVTGEAGVTAIPGVGLYLIGVSQAEALCGHEDVYGKLCEEACVSSRQRPYRIEGVVLRAVPLTLQTALPTSAAVTLGQIHLRSRVASAYFADEALRIGHLISKAGLGSPIWCAGAAAAGGRFVPLGVLARSGSATIFLDSWTARRERIDAQPRRHWQWRTMMRPWDVFLAQILQFQCQLRDTWTGPVEIRDDPCEEWRKLVVEAGSVMEKVEAYYKLTSEKLAAAGLGDDPELAFAGGDSQLQAVLGKLVSAKDTITLLPNSRVLISRGIVELPSAGYLPVVPGAAMTVNEQVRAMMGEGVDLRFCVVRPDFVAHALEEAQHMERIPLMQGLDDPTKKPKVDILVPNGEIIEQRQLSPGRGFEATLELNTVLFTTAAERPAILHFRIPTIPNPTVQLHGAARTDKLPSGGGAAYLAAELVGADSLIPALHASDTAAQKDILAAVGKARAGSWISLICERNVFDLKRGDVTNINARGIVAATSVANTPLLDIELNGILEITHETVTAGNAQSLNGRIENAQLSFLGQSLGNPGPRKAIFVNLDVAITLTGGSTIEIILSQQPFRLKLSGGWGKQPLEVNAAIATLSNAGEGPPAELVLGALKENADVLSAANASHKQALDALDIVGSALRDVNFVAAKARLLFPPPPPLTDDIVVRSTLDWVLFHRRRDKQCSAVDKVPQVKPPQTYRVFNITTPTLEAAQARAEELGDPAAFAKFVKKELATSPSLFIKYADDSTQPLFEFRVADNQWKLFKPGRSIAFVFYGAKDKDNEVLQTNRLRQFESAIGDDSEENDSTTLKPLVPLPGDALPPDADGVMLFITIADLRKALLVYGRLEGRIHNLTHGESPFKTMEFHDNAPHGDALNDFIRDDLASRSVVRGVTLATTKARPDPGATVRLKAVIDALVRARKPRPVPTRQTVESLNSDDRKELRGELHQDPDGFDEIIFFEFDDEA